MTREEAPPGGFPQAEFEARTARAQALMAEREIDALLLTIEPGMAFAPGKLMVHEENIAITEGPAELLSRRAPPEMPVIS